jgi:exonuclease SbcC
MPDARTQVARCAREKEQVQEELNKGRRRHETLAGAPQALAWAEDRESAARERVDRMAVLASREQACAQAKATLTEIDRDLAALGSPSMPVAQTPEEQAERGQIETSRLARNGSIAVICSLKSCAVVPVSATSRHSSEVAAATAFGASQGASV